MKEIIKTMIDLTVGFLLIKLKPLDTWSYAIGLSTMLFWICSDLIYKKYFKK